MNGDRQLGAMGGASNIPFTSLDRYAARRGIEDADEFERFRAYVRAIDAEYLAYLAEKQKKPDKKPTRRP